VVRNATGGEMKASITKTGTTKDLLTNEAGPITCHSLSASRKKMGLSTSEVADHLKISKTYIDAIEKHNFHALPPTSYTLGFIRTLAAFYGLDPIETANIYKEKIAEKGINLNPDQEIKEITPLNKPSSNYILIGLLLTISVILGGYYLISSHSEKLKDLKDFIV